MSLQAAYRKVGEAINAELVNQLDEQGHRMTGKLQETLEVLTDDKGVSGVGELYGIFVNLGVKAEQIKYPYARARIEGLTRFAQFRMGVDEKTGRSIAFAIATKHAREGMPTADSYKYSKNGKRTDSIDDAIESAAPLIQEIFYKEFVDLIDKSVKVTGR